MKAYRDTWGQGLDTYLRRFSETVQGLRELLTPEGSAYVHLDWHVGSYARMVLDDVFGRDSFKNEIIWKRSTAHSDAATYGNVHDTLYMYTKGNRWTWNQPYSAYTDEYITLRIRTNTLTGNSDMPTQTVGDFGRAISAHPACRGGTFTNGME